MTRISRIGERGWRVKALPPSPRLPRTKEALKGAPRALRCILSGQRCNFIFCLGQRPRNSNQIETPSAEGATHHTRFQRWGALGP